jgi:hypothetical protein
MERDEAEPHISPALERRLAEVLALLRREQRAADPHFVSHLLGRARSQRTVRDVLVLIAMLARSVPDALLLVRGSQRPRSDARE